MEHWGKSNSHKMYWVLRVARPRISGEGKGTVSSATIYYMHEINSQYK